MRLWHSPKFANNKKGNIFISLLSASEVMQLYCLPSFKRKNSVNKLYADHHACWNFTGEALVPCDLRRNVKSKQ